MSVPVFRPSAIDPRLLVNEHMAADELAGSRLLQATVLTLQCLETNGHIGLTKSGAFNRQFVTWAVEEFCWPGYTADELYKINKVLNEIDVLPLEFLHDLLRNARIIRHRNGKALITQFGRSLLERPGHLQAILFETLFTQFDFSAYERWPSPIHEADNLHILGVVQQRCGDWMEFPDFAADCLPIPFLLNKHIATEEDAYFHVYGRVVRPLSWLGLILSKTSTRLAPLEDMLVRRSQLFERFLAFDYDEVCGVEH